MIGQGLVFGINGCDRVFAVHDRGDGCFEHDVFDTCGVGGTDAVVGVNLDFQVEAVVDQQNRCWAAWVTLPTNKLRWVGERRNHLTGLDGVGVNIGV